MRSLPFSGTRLLAAAAAAGLAVGLTACNTDPYATELTGDSTDPADPADPAESTSGGDGDLVVIGPLDGDTVTTPFEVAVGAGVELGEVEDGLHHVHIWFDDQPEEAHTMHFSDTTTVEEAPAGETTMWVQLADAEHELLGEPISLALTVEAAEGGGEDDTEDDTGGGDDGYDY